ncbi:hypothetical protein ACFDTO_36325 [Microbacteriaceae bacterium 4G12]
MEYKTPMIAEKLGISPKVVLRTAQQLNLNVTKNKFGHYVFTEEDVQQIMHYHSASQECAAAVESSIEPPAHLNSYDTNEKFLSLEKQLKNITKRLTQNEDKIHQKADDVVNYQLLQHRSEIEDLQQKIQTLEAVIHQLEVQKPPKEQINERPKRRKMILSIFGL